MSSQSDCDKEKSGLAGTGFRWRAVFDRALTALETGMNSVVFIGALRVGIKPWPRDRAEHPDRVGW